MAPSKRALSYLPKYDTSASWAATRAITITPYVTSSTTRKRSPPSRPDQGSVHGGTVGARGW